MERRSNVSFREKLEEKFGNEIRRRISSLLRFLGSPRILINFPKTNLPRGSREISLALRVGGKLFPRAGVRGLKPGIRCLMKSQNLAIRNPGGASRFSNFSFTSPAKLELRFRL